MSQPNRIKKNSKEVVAIEEEPELFEKVVHINRCAKVVKGGRRFSFAALVVVGDQQGNVGFGYGKAQMVPDAIRKGTDKAKKAMGPVSISGDTIPHPILEPMTEEKYFSVQLVRGRGLLPVVAFALSLRLLGSKMFCPSHLDPTTSSRSLPLL